ncbi:transposase IS4 family protein [Halomonas sp. HAL1]|nr:transposase IS4 family protein [Halomonas sp. HAL1]
MVISYFLTSGSSPCLKRDISNRACSPSDSRKLRGGESRSQAKLFPELLDDFVSENNPVRAIEAFVDAFDLKQLGFKGVDPHATGRPAYHPAVFLKIYLYGYLNRVQPSRRLEREAQRNIELMWLTERLTLLRCHRSADVRVEGKDRLPNRRSSTTAIH